MGDKPRTPKKCTKAKKAAGGGGAAELAKKRLPTGPSVNRRRCGGQPPVLNGETLIQK